MTNAIGENTGVKREDTLMDNYAPVLYGVIAALISFVLAGFLYAQQQAEQQAEQAKRCQEIMKSAPIPAKDFLANWRVGGRKSRLGYASINQSGCYVILINPTPQDNGDVHYEEVYVGQSVHVCTRIRQHLTGHGNGDVYADVREGKNVQIRIVPCEKRDMNRIEKELIAVFHATDSYNRTRGGSRKRQ